MLDEPRMRAALERVLPPDTRVAIHDFSRHSVPHGELVFTMAGLGRPSAKDPDSPVVWRGRLKYGARSSVPVWAKVRLARLETWIETTSRLEARKAIAADQVALKTGWRFPLGESTIRNLDEVIGMLPARSLPAGQILLAPLLHKPYVVSSGDSIEVEVMSGPVHIRFAARAATNARNDETVLIVMPESGKRLQARVRGKGKVSIDVDAYRKTPEMAVAAGAADRLNAHRVGQGEETTPAGDAAGSISQ
jgi:flagella basal body P-ring formation protein FlgA